MVMINLISIFQNVSAASVKNSLVKDFSIDETRIETDGKGESEPIAKNDSGVNKAKNRRVEFIKL